MTIARPATFFLVLMFMGFGGLFASPARAQQGTPASGQPAYLSDSLSLEIFDPAEGEILTPIQRAAKLLARPEDRMEAFSLANIENLITYEYEIVGQSEEAILETARVRALKSSAARLYFENFLLLGLDLLEPYLERVGENFIAQTTVLERRILTGDQIRMRVRLSVNLDPYYEDLREKQFVATPDLRPILSIHMLETVNGQEDYMADGQQYLAQILEQNLFRSFSNRLPEEMVRADLRNDPGRMLDARLTAQRQSVDLLVTGRLDIADMKRSQILFDEYTFREAEVGVSVYRVDNGEFIDSFTSKYSAAAPSTEAATQSALVQMLTRTGQRMADRIREMWSPTMLDRDQYRLMISGVNRNELTRVYNLLRTLSPDLRIYERAFYGDVVVFNVLYPGGRPSELETFLRESSEPQFSIRSMGERRFELELI